MPYALISFDLDGTLVDTAGEIAEAANRTLEDYGVARRPVDEITTYIGAGTRELMRRLTERIVAEQPARADDFLIGPLMAVFDRHYEATVGSSGRPYPGCHDSLERLRAAGVRLACVTNKEAHFARKVLELTQLDGYFELMIGGDTLPQKKPHAEVLQHVMRQFGVSAAETAHVGDSRTDIESARNAGVAAWALPHGYNGGVPVETAGPDRLFPDLPSVADHVLRLRAA